MTTIKFIQFWLRNRDLILAEEFKYIFLKNFLPPVISLNLSFSLIVDTLLPTPLIASCVRTYI